MLEDMKLAAKLSLVLVWGLAGRGVAQGVDADAGNPYARISDRNAFALKDPPPLPDPTATIVQPPQKITLLGIVSWGKVEVIFKVPVAPKPGEQAKDTSFTLGAGERAGEIEVVDIDPATGTVKFVNNKVPQTLTLEKDGLKPSGAPPPAGAPAMPGIIPAPRPVPVPGGGVPTAGAAPNLPAVGGTPVTTFGGNPGGSQFGGAANVRRELRVPGTTAAGYAGATGAPAPGTSQTPATPSLEEHTIILEVARKLTQEKVDAGLMPPLPPTAITGK